MRKKYLLVFVFSFIFYNSAFAVNYTINSVSLQTKNFIDGTSKAYLIFTILDVDEYYFPPVLNVVSSVTLKDQHGNIVTYPSDLTIFYQKYQEISDLEDNLVRLTPYSLMENRSVDRNRNGIIEPNFGEYEVRAAGAFEYTIPMTLPVLGGDYNFKVTCTNGQTLYFDLYNVSPAVVIPPVNIITAKFDENGRLKIAWALPDIYSTNYQNSNLQIRIERFEKEGIKRFMRFRIDNLPLFLNGVKFEEYTLLKFESDMIRYFAPYIKVQIRINYHNSVGQSRDISYAINGIEVTPAIIPDPLTLFTAEEVSLAIDLACPGNSEYAGRPDSPGKSNPLGQNKK